MIDWERLRFGPFAVFMGTLAVAFITASVVLTKYKDDILSVVAPSGYSLTINRLEERLAEKENELNQKLDNDQLNLYLDIGWGRSSFKSTATKGIGSTTHGPDKKIIADLHKAKGAEIIYFTTRKELKFYTANDGLVEKVRENNKHKLQEKNLIVAVQAYDITGVSPVNIVGDYRQELMMTYDCNCTKQTKGFALYKFFEDEIKEIWTVGYKDDGRKWFDRLRFVRSETNTIGYDIVFDGQLYVYSSRDGQFYLKLFL